MADPPAYSRGRIQAFGHSGDATGTHGVFPSHRWFQRQLNTRLSRRPGAVRAKREGPRSPVAASTPRRPIPCDSPALVARDALPGVIIACHRHPRDGGFEGTLGEIYVGRERARRDRIAGSQLNLIVTRVIRHYISFLVSQKLRRRWNMTIRYNIPFEYHKLVKYKARLNRLTLFVRPGIIVSQVFWKIRQCLQLLSYFHIKKESSN